MTIPGPGQGWSPDQIEAIAPQHIDFARMRRFVAAFATTDGVGISDVMNEATRAGRMLQLLGAAAAQLATEHDLDQPEHLDAWRQGIAYHINAAEEEDSQHE